MSRGWTWQSTAVRMLAAGVAVALLAASGVAGADGLVERDSLRQSDQIGVVEPVAERHVPFERPEPSTWPDQVSTWVDRHRMTRGTYRLELQGRTWVLVAWGQKPTGGYQVRVEDAVRTDVGTIRFTVRLAAPSPGAMVVQMLTHPFDLITIDGTGAPLAFQFTGAPWDDEPAAATDPSGQPTGTDPDSLTDVKGHWAEGALRRAVAEGLVKGYPDGRFQPDDTISRAEFIVLLTRAFAVAGAEVDAGDIPPFSDLGGHWAAAAVAAAVRAGIVEPSSAGDRFRPDDPVDRLQAATWLLRALGRAGSTVEYRGHAAAFGDVEGLTPEQAGYVGAAAALGLVAGYPDGTWGPHRGATRAEAVVIIQRAR